VEQIKGTPVQGAGAVIVDKLGHDAIGLAKVEFGFFQECLG
jgi:hypothetical protein